MKCAGSYCVGFSWCSTCLSILITFLVLQILWPFIFIVADVCIVLDNVPKNVTSYVPMDDYSASMLQSCFDNTTVLPPGAEGEGNSTGGLDFASKVGFGSASKPLSEVDADLDDMFEWPWLDKELSYVDKMGRNLTKSPKSCAGSSNVEQCTCLNERTEAIFKIKDMYKNIKKEKAIFKDCCALFQLLRQHCTPFLFRARIVLRATLPQLCMAQIRDGPEGAGRTKGTWN